MSKKSFSMRSFEFAFRGMLELIRVEPNSRIHFIAACLAVILGFVLKINVTEWLFVTVAIGSVFITELFNSSVEKIADVIDPDFNPKIKVIKDLSAAGVLVAALTSVVIGIVIFVPKILSI